MDQLKIKSPSIRDTDWFIYRLNDMISKSTSGGKKQFQIQQDWQNVGNWWSWVMGIYGGSLHHILLLTLF